MTLTYGSLFSGAGGFDMGFDAAGFRCAWQVEIDPAAQRVLRRHWPEVPKFLDVRDVGAHNLTPVDVVIFGSPCQDLSIAGKRAGLEGSRSGLFFEATRILRDLRPAWAIWENVADALSSNHGHDFAAVLDEMGDCGFVALGWRVLDAQFWGIPQRRRRVFLVGSARADGPEQVLFERQGVHRHPATGRTAGAPVASLTANGVGTCGADDNQAQAGHLLPVASALTARYGKGTDSDASDALVYAEPITGTLSAQRAAGNDLTPCQIIASSLTASAGHHGHSSPRGDGADNLVAYPIQDAAGPVNKGQGSTGIGDDGDPMYTLDTLGRHGVAMTPEIADTLRSHPRPGSNSVGAHAFDNHTGTSGEQAATLRATEHGALPMVANTLTAPGPEGGRRDKVPMTVEPGAQVRRLTPRECERLMGWPDDHTRWADDGAELSDSSRYRLIGNGVAAPVAAWLAHRLRGVMEPEECQP